MVKIMENPIKIDDLGVPLFLEIPILACAPSPVFLMTTRTINYMFRFGDPNLNFHVSRYWEGGEAKLRLVLVAHDT